MANQPNPNQGGQQQAAPPPPPPALPILDVKVIDQQYLSDRYQATFEATVTLNGVGVPGKIVRLSERGITHQSGPTGTFGTYTLFYEAPLAPTPTTHPIEVSVGNLRWSATISLAAAEKPDVVSEDPERVVVNGFIIDEAGLVNVDIRVVKGKGRAASAVPVMVVFPDLQLQYERTTDSRGHCKFQCPHLIEPGDENLIIISVDGIEKACEIRIANHVRPIILSAAQIESLARRRPSYWVFGIPGWLTLPALLIAVVKLFSTTPAQDHAATQQSNDIMWIFVATMCLVSYVIYWFDKRAFKSRIRLVSFYRQSRFERSRRVRETSSDPWMEHMKETMNQVFGKKNHGPTVTVHTPPASTGGAPAATASADHGSALMTQIVIEFFTKGAWEMVESWYRKIKK